MKEIIIDRGITQSRIGVFEDGKLQKLHIEDSLIASISGNIYLGRVENIVKGMNAAFINIGIDKNALLHLDDVDNPDMVKRGSSLLVQVIREGSGDKGPRVTTTISIPGKYMVIHPGVEVFGVSKKINSDETRNRLKGVARSLATVETGIVLRTEAADASREELEEEFTYLNSLWAGLRKNEEYLKPPQTLFNARDLFSYIFRELIKPDVNIIYFNKAEDRDYFKNLVMLKEELKHITLVYEEHNFSYFRRLEDEIEKLVENRVELPSGGFIIVEKTEAAVIVDVNSGNYEGSSDFHQAIFQTNIEASEVIYNYITLQNLSGIIIIDYINMVNKKDQNDLLTYLSDRFKQDKVPTRIFGFTELGLVEISRARKAKRVLDNIYRDKKSLEYTAAYALKKIENICLREMKQKKINSHNFFVSLYLKQQIESNYSNFKKIMKQFHGINIDFTCMSGIRNYTKNDELAEIKKIKIELDGQIIEGNLKHINEDRDGNIYLYIKKL